MLCVIAKLDAAATERLEAIRRPAFPDGAAQPLHGHITLATWLGERERDFVLSCRELLEDLPAFALEYAGVEVLEETSIIAALPRPSAELLTLHRRLAERFGDALDPWTGTERWLPHTTLLYRPGADLQGLARKLREGFAPFWAEVRAIEFSRVLDGGYEIVNRAELGPR